MAAQSSLSLRATYEVVAHVYWKRGAMTVSTNAHVTNTTDRAVKTLTFNLVPLVTGAADVVRVAVDGKDVQAGQNGQTLTVPLPRKLRPGERTHVKIRYHAVFNSVSDSRVALFGKQDDVITAYRWIPWLSRKQRFAAPNMGETWVSAVSPRVRVTLISGKSLVYATSGRRTGERRKSQTFVARNVRDFNFSASPDYRVRRTRVNGVRIRVFYRDLPAKELAGNTVASLKRFNELVGGYPYRQLNIAEVPLGSGMESPGLSWIPVTVKPSRLEQLVAHEVAHQWFYATVGNNQARNPFVDEAMAAFLADDMVSTFRTPRCAKDELDKSVYGYSAKCYPEVIYVQGARYIEKYRSAVGDEAFWAGVRQFYSDYAFKIAGTRALLDTLDAASGYDSELHAKRFPNLYR